MSHSDYHEVIQQFPLFRGLSRRALKAANRQGRVDHIAEHLQAWKAYSRTEWLRNIVQIRNTLIQFTARRAFEMYGKNFRFLEPTARVLMEEICDFCDWNIANSWPVHDDDCSVDEYQQLTIDGFDALLKQTFQRALYVGHWTQRLFSLCRTLKKLPSKMQIKISRLRFDGEDAFATGGYGSVYKAILLYDDDEENRTSQIVAVKFMRYEPKASTIWTNLHDEALSLLNLEIPGLNPFIGVTMDPQRGLGLVSPYLEHGTAVKYLSKRNMNIAERIVWVCTVFPIIMSAIHQLHYVNLTHGDIKGTNILIDNDEKPRLTDFGLARVSASKETNTWVSTSETVSYAYTLRFCSPERILSERLYTSKEDDVWAFGMTLVELLTGQLPFFPKMSDIEVMTGLYEGTLTMQRCDVPVEVHEDLWELIRGCTEIDPQNRWSSFQVYTAMEGIRGKYAIGEQMPLDR
ncbi:hypothetical protein ACEPAF_8783 [Sanghuangporus sanghuang]